MSLEDTIKNLKSQIAEEDDKEIPEDEAEVVEEPVEEAKPEEKPEEPEAAKEEPKPEEPAPVVDEKPDAAAFQRLRREAAAAKKQAAEAETKRLEMETRMAERDAEPKEEAAPLPIIPGLDDMLRSHQLTRAEQEFKGMESSFRRTNPEYDAIANEYGMAIAQSIRIQNPRLSNDVIAERTRETILLKAAKFLNDGFDPVEELFHEAKDLGFNGQSAKKAEPAKEIEVKPDMAKLAANRSKSTGMTAASGRSAGQLTQKAATELTSAEWMKLPAAEKHRLLYPTN